jgi:hypothetical protein
MIRRIILIVLASSFCAGIAMGQEVVTYKVALVALAEDADVRATFEDSLAAKAAARKYDAVASYDIVPRVTDVDNRDFIERLRSQGISVVLMMRPAAVGAGSTLESVRNSVSADVYSNMRKFAREISPSGDEDLFAVVHLAIYLLANDGARLLSAGAVWLDEETRTTEQAIERLQDLVLDNADKVRGPIREYLGLPPLQ